MAVVSQLIISSPLKTDDSEKVTGSKFKVSQRKKSCERHCFWIINVIYTYTNIFYSRDTK